MCPLHTPAQILAERVAALTPGQRDSVENWWRRNGSSGPHTTGPLRTADELAHHWTDPASLSPKGDEPAWDVAQEALLQHGLDRLLRHSHPDTGFANESGDPHVDLFTIRRMREQYQATGYLFQQVDDDGSPTALVLPRRHRPPGPSHTHDSPLIYSIVLTTPELESLTIVRPRESRRAGDPDAGLLRARHCATAPVIGEDALTVQVYRGEDRWLYRPALTKNVVDDDAIARLIANANATGARLLALPEYAAGPEDQARWESALQECAHTSLEWVLIGSGPTDEDPNGNVAVLVSGDGQTAIRQPKTRPFDLDFSELATWTTSGCPDEPPQERVREDIHPTSHWWVVEANTGRLAVTVCESVKPRVDDSTLATLGKAIPTLILCPVLSKPTHDSRWERASTEQWSSLQAEVVVANSLVRSDWISAEEDAESGEAPPPWTGTGGLRQLDGRSWNVRFNRRRTTGSPITELGQDLPPSARVP